MRVLSERKKESGDAAVAATKIQNSATLKCHTTHATNTTSARPSSATVKSARVPMWWWCAWYTLVAWCTEWRVLWYMLVAALESACTVAVMSLADLVASGVALWLQ
eukprot:TRINITY_DN2494_c0_g1_i1.p2 TRINITY_DN2494_c0_g1~~TRINITY_DN2494_c0_g1_i1.p2  ORF type:complete len:106 (+),score=25.59 TRINITY_DN2494_c0_g1_i1:111-428(+)